MPDEGLRLHEAAGKSELHAVLFVSINGDDHGGAERWVERLQRAFAVEIPRRHRVCVRAQERFRSLVHGAGNVQPAKLMDGRIDA